MVSYRDDEFVLLAPEDVQDYNDDGILPQSSEDFKKIVDWLQPTAYNDSSSEYTRHLRSHVRGTGDWLSGTDVYRQWRGAEGNNVLWVKAVPGTGKSVLAAHQRAHISSTEAAPVLHFFFRQIITSNRTPTQLVRDWIAQLLVHSPRLQKRIMDDYVEMRKSLASVAFQGLWRLLKETVAALPRVYCFADALDEMSLGNEDFCLRLIELGEIASCRVFMTSRPVPRLVQVLRNQSILAVTLGPENMEEDISTYVDHRIDHDIGRYVEHRLRSSKLDLERFGDRSHIEDAVRSSMRSKSRGSFLYAKLMMDNLLAALEALPENCDLRMVTEILDGLPQGLSDMYDSMLSDHARRSGTPIALQHCILQCITHSERPLRLLELSSALSFNDGERLGITDTKATLRKSCGPLIEILPSDVVGPIHHSFTEYLTTPPSTGPGSTRQMPLIASESAHRAMAGMCLDYIFHVDADEANRDSLIRDLKLKYPFLNYALANWSQHCAKSGPLDDELASLLDRLIIKQTELYQCLRRCLSVPSDNPFFQLSRQNPKAFEGYTPMHAAAYAGMSEYIKRLAKMGYDHDAPDAERCAPMHYAAQKGHSNCIEALVALGAKSHTANLISRTPLMDAARNDHVECVEALLRSGLDSKVPRPDDVQSPTSGGDQPDFRQATQDAIREGHVRTVQALLRCFSNRHLLDVCRFAMQRNQPGVGLAILADPRFDLSLASPLWHCHQNPLYKAAAMGSLPCMRELLRLMPRHVEWRKCACECGCGTPLHAFVGARKTKYSVGLPSVAKRPTLMGRDIELPDDEVREGIELLLQAGVPIDARDVEGHTALFLARNKHVVASLLLDRGASPLAALDHGGNNPLHLVGGVLESEEIELWTGQGFGINSRNLKGETPLHSFLQRCMGLDASKMGNSVSLLLRFGADPKIVDNCGASPLHTACRFNDTESLNNVFRLLTDAGADVDARDIDGNSPLLCLRPVHVVPCLQTLLDLGADPEAKNNEGRTLWLRLSESRGRPMPVEDLLKFGFDPRQRDARGASALHLLATHAPCATLQAVADLGLDPKAVDHRGNTLLHYTAWSFIPRATRTQPYADLVAWVLDQGVDPLQPNHSGQTAFDVTLMLAHGAEGDQFCALWPPADHVNRSDRRGTTPLHLAVCRPSSLSLHFLEHGADPTCTTGSGQTALHFAAAARNTDGLSLIIGRVETGLERFVNRSDGAGMTALHVAARSGVSESVRVLLDAGADAKAQDLQGRTPLDMCATFPQEVRDWARAEGDGNKFSRPGAMETVEQVGRGWSDIARQLAVKHASPRPGRGCTHGRKATVQQRLTRAASPDLSIRRCVRLLLSAGAAVVGDFAMLLRLADSDVPRGFSNDEIKQEFRNERLLQTAMDADCEPMAEEILDRMSAHDGSTGDRRYDPRQRVRREVQKRQYRSRREWSRDLADVEGDAEAYYDLTAHLVEKDCAETLASMPESAVDGLAERRPSPSEPGGIENSLTYLARHGCHDALRRLQPRLMKKYGSPKDVSRAEVWLASLEPDYVYACRGIKPIARPPREALAEPLDGLLLASCERGVSNVETMKVIVEQYGCSELERRFALFLMVRQITTGPRWHVDAVEYLISTGIDADTRDPLGRTLLMALPRKTQADQRGVYAEEMLRRLLKSGADPGAVSKLGESCLERLLGQEYMVRILLRHGVDLGREGRKILQQAIWNHDLEVVRLILEKGHDLNTRGTREDGFGSGLPHLEMKRRLLQASYPLHVAADTCHDQKQLMSAAVRKRADDIFQLLLDNGADLYAITEEGSPIVHDVLASGRYRSMILDRPDLDLERRDVEGRTMLLALAHGWTVSKGQMAEQLHGGLKRLLERGADYTVTDNKGRNILHHLAGHEGHWRNDLMMETVLKLPKADSLVNAKDVDGRRPVHAALARYGRDDTATWLLHGHGADLGEPDVDGSTALHRILGAFKLKQEAKADAPATGPQPEAFPEFSRPEDVYGYLVEERGLDVNALDASGEPALFRLLRACPLPPSKVGEVGKKLEAFESDSQFLVLLKRMTALGMDVHVLSRGGRCALHELATNRQRGTARPSGFDGRYVCETWNYLVQCGLDPWMEDEGQRSALDVAASTANWAVMDMY